MAFALNNAERKLTYTYRLQPGGSRNGEGNFVSAVTGRDQDWSTHSAPGGSGGWAGNGTAVSQPQPTYRCAVAQPPPIIAGTGLPPMPWRCKVWLLVTAG